MAVFFKVDLEKCHISITTVEELWCQYVRISPGQSFSPIDLKTIWGHFYDI